MNTLLWEKIEAFEFDEPFSEYCFSIRLAKENSWSHSITKQAILEYKKFMYLAATCDFMVSPSGIIDTVWHQHLIFTQSYFDFCKVLGKQIQHVPSTHQESDFEKFKQAKINTKIAYEKEFGEQPHSIWDYDAVFDSLKLPKAKWKVRSMTLFGVFGVAILLFPCYFLLLPLFLRIQNPIFGVAFFIILILLVVFLECWNRFKLRGLLNEFHPDSFLFQLDPLEVSAMKNYSSHQNIHFVVDKLIQEKKIVLEENQLFSSLNPSDVPTLEEKQIVEILSIYPTEKYGFLFHKAKSKPIFSSKFEFTHSVEKYISKSTYFLRLYCFNFIFLASLFMLGLTRVFTGISQQKPIVWIGLLVLLTFVASFVMLKRLTRLMVLKIIPDWYKMKVADLRTKNIFWNYFLRGKSVLLLAFVSVVEGVERHQNPNSNSSCSSSCGSSCGSTCGSSCGGCGGD